VGQARLEVTSTVDFEERTTNDPMYFLYKGEGATDANDKNGLQQIKDSI